MDLEGNTIEQDDVVVVDGFPESLISQVPAGGRFVAPGTEVRLTVQLFEVPDVSGQSLSDASVSIRQNDLEIEASFVDPDGNPFDFDTSRFSQDADQSIVISQDPAANSNVLRGTTVQVVAQLVEIRGELVVTRVPDVRGLSVSEARDRVSELRLRLEVSGFQDADGNASIVEDVDVGGSAVVVSQRPPPGFRINGEDAVRVFVQPLDQ